ncbi:hypothetical protein LSAT2_013373, partial [Lamellibrachia satsuma]
CEALPGTISLTRTANRVRAKLRPDEPRDLQFQVFALPFLPADHISAAFDALMAQTTTFALVDLMDYIQRIWLRSRV